MTLGEAIEKAIKLINEYSNNGSLINTDDGNYLDYSLRMKDLANDAQMEIARFIKIPDVHSITQWPAYNLLGTHLGFDMEHFEPGTDRYYTASGAKSYYFEVDRPCTVYIEEETSGVWTILDTLVITDITQFTGYKGNITASDPTNAVRLRLTGSYPCTIRNRALFKNSYPTDDDVPIYKPFVPYELPDDYMEFDKIMRWYDQRQYQLFTGDYRFTGKKTVEINWFLDGQFDIHYFKLPTEIDKDTDDDYEFEIDVNAQTLIPYYIGGHVLIDQPSKQNVALFLKQQYDTKLANLSNSEKQYQTGEIVSIRGW
ncbi:MAG: hypothetical protein GX638_14690 [Crenarchaeota archaeon]|nr:hypothetical protein [Thermoproteota archaeon]